LINVFNYHTEVGAVLHECESELVCKLTEKESKVPHFNAGIYLENKKKIGKVDEIFGPITGVMFTVKPDPGVFAKSFQKNDVVYIGIDKLLPLTRFTNPGKPTGGGRGPGAGGGRGPARGGGRGRGGTGRGPASG
jgi:rRNA processing protein Gar1